MKLQKIDESTFSVLNDDGTIHHNVSVPHILRRHATILEVLAQTTVKKNLGTWTEEEIASLSEQIERTKQDLAESKLDLLQAQEAGFDI